MVTTALGEDGEQQALRIVLDYLQTALNAAKVTLAEITGEGHQEGAMPASSELAPATAP